jgi:hypothetical protein
VKYAEDLRAGDVIYDSWNSENEIPLYYWVKETEE